MIDGIVERRDQPPVYRRARPGDGPRLLDLYRQAFAHHGGTIRGGMAHLSGPTVVAEVDHRLVGFGCWHVVRDPATEPELRTMLGNLDPVGRALLGGDTPVALPVRVEAPPGLVVELAAGDVVFTALAVVSALRRRGIGTGLARARLALARASGAGQVFVHCVDGSGSRALYEALGFAPLVTTDRHYPDGSGMTLLYSPTTDPRRPKHR